MCHYAECTIPKTRSTISSPLPCPAQSGHALAAASEGVPIRHFAVFLALGLPGAYVMLDHDTLAGLSPMRILRVRL